VGPVGASPAVTDTCTDTPKVQFTASVTGSEPLTYAWSFGDGGTASDPRPTHKYKTSAHFPVKLTVTNSAGSATGSTTVHVGPCIGTQPTTGGANTATGGGATSAGTGTVGTVSGGTATGATAGTATGGTHPVVTATPVAAIPNVGERRARLLTDSGRATAADVAAMSTDEIAEVLKVSPELAETIRQGAREVSGKE
jgi:PKD repeat protein